MLWKKLQGFFEKNSEPDVDKQEPAKEPVFSVGQVTNYANKDLLWINDWEVPSVKPGDSAFSIILDENFNITSEEYTNENDPSTIFTRMPFSLLPAEQSLGYWPSYYSMSPRQKGKYLLWLKDVTQETDVGFVFTYYYGLERHLVIGRFHEAFDEIVKLRRYHINKSFHQYSKNALIFSCLIRKDITPLLRLNTEDQLPGFSAVQMLLAYNLELDLSPKNLAFAFCEIDAKAKTAVKENIGLFQDCITEMLIAEFGSVHFPFSKKYNIEKLPRVTLNAFCNYGFPAEVRTVDIADFYKHKEFRSELERIFTLSYEMYKERKSVLRQMSKSEMTAEEVEEKRIFKEKKRLDSLYRKGILKKKEYEILIAQL